jgi:transposase
MGWFAGLDWGSERHAVCVVDREGKIAAHFEVAHDAAGLAELRAKLAKVAPHDEVPIAIERPSGLLVDSLVEAGHVVVPIHPNVVKACRPRYRAVGAKSDLGDAYLLADVLRTDGHRFRPLTPQSDGIKALRALVRTRDDLVAGRVAMANQLRALLESFWPGAVAIFADIDSPIALAFLQRYPTPKMAAALGPKRLASFLAQHEYCGRRTATELLERLNAAPVGLARGAEANAKGELVRAWARIIKSLVDEITLLSARIRHEVAQLPEGRVVMSFPRAGQINAAQIVAELGDVRERFQTEDQLAAEAGVSPVTYESGKSRGVGFRWACNKHLRSALTLWAANSRRSSPWANDVYARARARGCDHPHAVRILARAWVRVLWRAWVTGSPYDAAQHGGAKKFLTAA